MTASVVSSKLDAKEETVSPLGFEESSSTAVSEADPVATGASLTAVAEVSRETV